MNQLTKLITYLSLTSALVTAPLSLQNRQQDVESPIFELDITKTTHTSQEATQETQPLHTRTVTYYPPNDSVVHQIYRYPNSTLWRETTQTYTNGVATMNKSRTYRYDGEDLTALIDSVFFSDAQESLYVTKYFKDRTEVYVNGERKIFNKSIL
jgi:hypothetical protein